MIKKTKDFELLARLSKDIHDLHVDIYPEYFEAYDYEAFRDNFVEEVKDEANEFYILYDEEPKGYIWLETHIKPGTFFKKEKRTLLVSQISVKKEEKHKGYGHQLMTFAYELAKKKNLNRIELDYWADNTDAEKFYQKEGFTVYRKYVFKDLNTEA